MKYSRNSIPPPTTTPPPVTSPSPTVFALSRQLSADALLSTVRAHWQIENALHWELDVAFREDCEIFPRTLFTQRG